MSSSPCDKGVASRIWSTFSDRADLLINLFYPNECLFCGVASPRGRRIRRVMAYSPETFICQSCQKRLLENRPNFCRRCGRPVGFSRENDKCGRCRADCFAFDCVAPLGLYRGMLRSVVLRMKLDMNPMLAETMAQLYYIDRREFLETFHADCVIAVPMHWRRRRQRRGVNSPETLAEELARLLNVPDLSRLVVRTRHTPPQTSVGYEERSNNVSDAFRVRIPYWPPSWAQRVATPQIASRGSLPLLGMRALLVDDAMTTCSTCNEVARALKSSGASAVAVAVLSRAGHDAAR